MVAVVGNISWTGVGGKVKLYVNTKKMIFKEDNIEHEIVVSMVDEEIIGYDILIELPNDDRFIKDILKLEYKKDKNGKDTKEVENKMFMVREQNTWWSFPLYEIIGGGMIPFDYTLYSYFSGTDRRMVLGKKISNLYNVYSEMKLHRKTLEFILNELNLNCPSFDKYNLKVKDIIKKNPKN